MCESVLCLICALLNNMVTSSLRGALTDARSEVPFSMETVLLVSELSLNSASVSPPFFKLRLQTCRGFRAGRSAQVELHRDDGVRWRNVMRKVAS